LTQGGGTDRRHDHQDVDVQLALADALPGIPHGVVAADRDRGAEQAHRGEPRIVAKAQRPPRQQQHAGDGAHQQFAMLDVPGRHVVGIDHAIAQRLEPMDDGAARHLVGVELEPHALGRVADRGLQHAVQPMQRVLDHGRAGGAVHAVDAHRLVPVAGAERGARRQGQAAHLGKVEAGRLVVQAEQRVAVLPDDVHLLQALRQQRIGQALDAAIPLVGNFREDEGQFERQLFGHPERSVMRRVARRSCDQARPTTRCPARRC
jgi:hypothetical protein